MNTIKVNRLAYRHKVVQIIDWTPLEQAIGKKCGYDVEVRVGTGYVENCLYQWDDMLMPFEKDIIIDAECCGVQSEHRHLLYLNEGLDTTNDLDREFINVGFFKKQEKEIGEDGSVRTFVSMMPSFYIDIDVNSIKKCIVGKRTLFEHCASRYGYNDRIQTNTHNTLSAIFGDKYSSGDTVDVDRDTGKEVLPV